MPSMTDEDRWWDERDRLSAVAVEAARVGAGVVRRAATQARPPSERKGSGDYVTRVDRDSESAIRRLLARRTPELPILGEEAGGEPAERYWAVDPLDGTTNFLIGFPVVDVSVALVDAGRPVIAAVELPLLGRSYRAVRGGGAWAGERRLAVSDRVPERAIVATALPFRRRERVPGFLGVLGRAFERIEDVRRAGPPRPTWPGSPKACSTATSSWGWGPGTWPPAHCSSRRPAGWLPTGRVAPPTSPGT